MCGKKTGRLGLFSAALALSPAAAFAGIVAFDMVNSTSQGLVSYTNPFTNAFTSAGDGFQKYRRGVSPGIPFSVLDDSLSIFPPDSLGIIDETNLDEFFGVVDTVNGDNVGVVTAEWVFDITGNSNLSVSIDIGAMGDFESSDTYTWSASIDGGPAQPLFSAAADELGAFTYTLAGGAAITLNDPQVIDGAVLANTLQTFTADVAGTGAQLTISFDASTDGGAEALVFQNLVVEGDTAGAGCDAPLAFDMLNSTSQGLLGYANPFTGFFTSAGDGFQKYRRGVSPGIPFTLLDDSVSIFPPDALGVIREDNLDEFFGVVDTTNGDNVGVVTAEWVFDISGIASPVVCIDMGAMGDFESSDVYTWSASIDGGPPVALFASSVDESTAQSYTLAGGAVVTLNDPLLMEGALLDNELRRLEAALPARGSTLVLTLDASTDGGIEAYVFQNIIIGNDSGGGGPQAVAIYDIQGNGAVSPLEGEVVTTSGAVTADFRPLNGTAGPLSGFFIQDPAGDGDGATSDGIYVFTGNGAFAAADIEVGDIVQVTGRVEEYAGDFTRLNAVSAITPITGGPVLAPVPAILPETLPGDLERYEGMLVQVATDMVIAQNFYLDRFGQLTLAAPGSTGRPFRPTSIFDGSADPASAAQLLRDENLRRLLVLDDGQDVSAFGDNPVPVPFFPSAADFQAGAVIRAGDGVGSLVGIVDQGNIGPGGPRDHRLQATAEPVFFARNPRTRAPDDVGGSLKVASFNVLNYFVTIDTGANNCGPDANAGCRGADNPVELDRQTAKLVAALCAVDADIVGLVEIENGPSGVNPAADALIAAMGDCGDGSGPDLYATAAPAGPLGVDVIASPFIYKPTVVAPVADAVLDKTVDPRFDTDFQRPAFAVTFEQLAGGARLTVVNNHYKSKGSLTGKPEDADQGDLQDNNNFTRTQASLALVDWLQTDPTGSGDSDYLVIGDLNSYGEEDPIQVFEDAGYEDLLERLGTDDAYTFTFDNEVGALDHGLASPTLSGQVSGVTIWHINTDEAEFTSYEQSFNPDGYFVADAYRSSDHDPVIIGLDLGAPPVRRCEVDGNGQIDINDVRAIMARRNQPATGPDDPADADGDGIVTSSDARQCVLQCDNARCAP